MYGFTSPVEERRFNERGQRLAGEVAAELGTGATVRYWLTDR